MPGTLEGKIALITGGSAGIGLATAKESVKEGASPSPGGLATSDKRLSKIAVS